MTLSVRAVFIKFFGRAGEQNFVSSLGTLPIIIKGLARRQVTSCFSMVLKSNMEVIHLGVNASNLGAVNSYKKLGFVQEGIRRKYVYAWGVS